MAFAIDANILIYAFNRDAEHHAKARDLLQTLAAKDETWVMPWPVIHAFLRISTHPAILANPLSPAEAVSALESLLSLPQVTPQNESSDFWEAFREDLLSIPLRGNGVPDAVIANILKSQGVSDFYTKDRDFRRFKGLNVIDPL